MPSDATATSRAAMPGISATPICQLKPMGLITGSIAWPIIAARLYSMAGSVAPSGGRGTLASTQITHIMARMVVPARFRKISPRWYSPIITLRASGRL